MKVFIVILVLVLSLISVYYFGFYKKGKINDRDGDYIPDEIEDTIEDVKAAAKEAKRRAKLVKEEMKDVVEEAKDVVDAIKGKKRRGRKPKAKK